MQNSSTRPAKPADLEIRPGTLGLPPLDRLPAISVADIAPPPGTTLIKWRNEDRIDFVRTDELDEYLTATFGAWEFGADNAGFEDFTVRDDEGDVLADLEEY